MENSENLPPEKVVRYQKIDMSLEEKKNMQEPYVRQPAPYKYLR